MLEAIRIVKCVDGSINICHPKQDEDYIYICTLEDEACGHEACNPDEWIRGAKIDKELSPEQVAAVFQALEEVFNEM